MTGRKFFSHTKQDITKTIYNNNPTSCQTNPKSWNSCFFWNPSPPKVPNQPCTLPPPKIINQSPRKGTWNPTDWWFASDFISFFIGDFCWVSSQTFFHEKFMHPHKGGSLLSLRNGVFYPYKWPYKIGQIVVITLLRGSSTTPLLAG